MSATGSRGVNTPGVKKLLEAEAKAAELVKKARNQKQLRMKQAREEAEAEIAAFRAQKEINFQKQQAANAGDTDGVAKSIKKETDERIQQLEKRVEDHRQEVVKTLLDIVCKVDPKVHENFASRKL